jgi:cytochrome c peroxidase
MRHSLLLGVTLIILAAVVIWDFSTAPDLNDVDELREVYASDPSAWPEPTVEDSIQWDPLGALPESPYRNVDSLEHLTTLGKKLFFDPRLSSSNQISCSSCHDPALAWSNGRPTAVGHDHRTGKRNVPSLLNIWAMEPLFWDGREDRLAEQIIHPISDPVEMNQNPEALPGKLAAIPGYNALFAQAFEDSTITLERMGQALAQFQRTIVSRESDFDRFVQGNEDALSDRALRGLHLFRTKARCMNCHHGPLFTDQKFHNLGLHYYGREREDLGRYSVTGDPDDMGKFRTPSLRDVMYTRPWFHNGLFNNIDGVMNMYNHGMARPDPRPEMKDDPHYPVTSDLLKELHLTDGEKDDLIAFMKAISERPYRMPRPELPGK